MRQRPKTKSSKRSRKEELKEAYSHLQRIIKDCKSHPCTILVDGQHISGNYLLVEIMNLPRTGPNLKLARNADPEDGLLDVVLVQEEEKDEFEELISKLIKDNGKLSVKCPPDKKANIRMVW